MSKRLDDLIASSDGHRVLQGAGDFLYVSLTAAVVNRKIKFYLLIWEEKLFIKLCLNSHRIIAAETEASL